MSRAQSVQNAFAVLELPSTASQEEVKTRYKKLALLHHPDKNPGNPDATTQFQKLGRAYNDLNRHFEQRQASSAHQNEYQRPPFYADSSFFPFNSFGHPPGCSCGQGSDDFDDYDDEYDDHEEGLDEDDATEFFRFIFEEMMNSRLRDPPRFYRKQRMQRTETPQEFQDRLRREREELVAAQERRAQEEVRRKERRQKEQEQESRLAAERQKAKAAKRNAAFAQSRVEAEKKLQNAKERRQYLRSDTFSSARRGDSANVRKRIYEDGVDAAGPEYINSDELSGQTASLETLLHIAATQKDLELVSWLIDHNAEPDEHDDAGQSVFHRALREGAPQIVVHLLNTFDPPSEYEDLFTPPSGTTVLRLATSSGVVQSVCAVLDAGLVDLADVDDAWQWLQGNAPYSTTKESSCWKSIRQVFLDIKGWNPPMATGARTDPPSPSIPSLSVEGKSQKQNKAPPFSPSQGLGKSQPGPKKVHRPSAVATITPKPSAPRPPRLPKHAPTAPTGMKDSPPPSTSGSKGRYRKTR